MTRRSGLVSERLWVQGSVHSVAGSGGGDNLAGAVESVDGGEWGERASDDLELAVSALWVEH